MDENTQQMVSELFKVSLEAELKRQQLKNLILKKQLEIAEQEDSDNFNLGSLDEIKEDYSLLADKIEVFKNISASNILHAIFDIAKYHTTPEAPSWIESEEFSDPENDA